MQSAEAELSEMHKQLTEERDERVRLEQKVAKLKDKVCVSYQVQ